MEFLSIIAAIALLLILVTGLKMDTFISFMLVCLFVGLVEGLSVADSFKAIQTGIGHTLGGLVIILGLGAMLGKLVAESGAAQGITDALVASFGIKRVQIALMTTGFIVGIPMFYTVGFVILVPFAITIAHNTKLSLLYVGLPMLASLSVTHGFLPPHPAPTAIAEMYGADIGLTLIYGMVVGVPAILLARWLLLPTMKKIVKQPPKEFAVAETTNEFRVPSLLTSFTIALMPVILIGGSSLLGLAFENEIISSIGNPAMAMLLSVLIATVFLGIKTGRSPQQVVTLLHSAVSSIAVVLLIIAGAGALKEVLIVTGISDRLGETLGSLGWSPLVLAWSVAAIMRVSVGSATVAGLTAAGIIMPLVSSSGVSPELMVLATGAGSIMLSHVNDGGFWLFKEYFNMSIPETLRSWTLMESIVSVSGLLGALLLNLIL
jgi:Gnt-I system high-affinity gluconate transporter